MSLSSSCADEFQAAARTRGASYFKEGRVRLTSLDETTSRARVKGSGEAYEVEIDWSDDALVADCTCPRFADGFLCKHVWATLLAVEAKGVSGTAARNGTPSLPARQASAPRNDWRRLLRPAFETEPVAAAGSLLAPETREAWVALDVSASAGQGGLVLSLFRRETRLDGRFGKFKPLAADPREIDRLTRPEDRALLELLLANDRAGREADVFYYAYRPKPTRIEPAAAAYEHLLPRLCAHERFVWLPNGESPVEQGRRVVWDDGPPWRFRLQVEPDDARRQWNVTGRLARPDAEPVPLERPVLLTDGAALFEDQLARFDAGGLFLWAAVLRRAESVAVPYEDRAAFLEQLWKLPSAAEADLPDDLRWEEVRASPQGRLRVLPPRLSGSDRLYAEVEFDYAGRTVPAIDPAAGVIDAERQRVFVRDRDAERRLLAELAAAGARPHRDTAAAGPTGAVALSSRNLPAVVERLVGAGWHVEAEGHRIRRPGVSRIGVKSGIDWFELSAEFDFDGVTARLPELLAALRKGEKYVRLDDGSQGLLPAEWLSQHESLLGLGRVEGDAVRFRPSQAMLLDALLAALPQVAVDRRFDRLRETLRTSAGVAARAAPRGFVGTLREYQQAGLGWLRFLQDAGFGGCLADDMGLGKTVQVLAHLESRRTRRTTGGTRSPSLAVVPRSLVFNWKDEAAKFTPKLRVLDYTGPERTAARDRFGEFDLILTTYGTLRRDVAELADVPFDYAILDESQAIKNTASQNAKACRLLRAEHRLAMTGTPIENHLGELWSLFEFLNPGLLGRSSAFRTLAKRAGEEADARAVLAKAVAPFLLRRTKAQVLSELPEKTEQTVHCELSGRERKRYDRLRDFYRAGLTQRIEEEGLERSKIHVLEALLRLRQAACHPGLLDKSKTDEPSAKLDALLGRLGEIVAEGHKALVFSQFTSLLGIVRARLDRQGMTYEYLDGRTRKRDEHVRRFQNDPDCRAFLISLKAGGQGLNLTAADYVFLLDPWWNPAAEAQAIDRAHRIGQERRVFAYRLIARGTVEERILELQRTKRDLADAIISADDGLLRRLTADDLTLLLS